MFKLFDALVFKAMELIGNVGVPQLKCMVGDKWAEKPSKQGEPLRIVIHKVGAKEITYALIPKSWGSMEPQDRPPKSPDLLMEYKVLINKFSLEKRGEPEE